jgi:hypothetical protein
MHSSWCSDSHCCSPPKPPAHLHSQVAQRAHTLPISDANRLDPSLWPVLQDAKHPALVSQTEVEAAGEGAEHEAVSLAILAHCIRVLIASS